MFYTIISNLPFIKSDTGSRKILKIFIIGSILYALLHYFLFQQEQIFILEQFKKYLYYMIAIDFGIAAFISSQPIEKIENVSAPPPNPTHPFKPKDSSPRAKSVDSAKKHDTTSESAKYTPVKSKPKKDTTPDTDTELPQFNNS